MKMRLVRGRTSKDFTFDARGAEKKPPFETWVGPAQKTFRDEGIPPDCLLGFSVDPGGYLKIRQNAQKPLTIRISLCNYQATY